jgi:hypothetical protein
MPAQQSPSFKLVQAIVQAKANLGQSARVSNIGDKLLLCLAHFALAVSFNFQRKKRCVVQQDQICHARLDAKANKASRLDRQTRTAIRGMKPNKAGHRAHSKMLTDGALDIGLIKQRCHNLRGKQMQPGMDFRGMS